MDDARFDRLARLVGAGGTRRALLAAVAGLAPAAVVTRTAQSEQPCGRRCTECEKCVNKSCRPVPDGRVCRRGRCRGGICRAGESECAVAAGQAAVLVTEAEFRDDTLRTEATVQPLADGGGTRSRIDVTFAGEPVLAIETERSGGALTVVVTYGDAFRGIRRARLTDDGAAVSGDIDGRAVVLPVGSSDPSELRFVDGGPPPDIKVNPDLMDAVAALLRQAEQGARECAPDGAGVRVAAERQRAPSGKGRRGKRRHGKGRRNGGGDALRAEANPEDDIECLVLYVPCQADLLSCEYGAATGCAGSLIFYVACALFATGICAVKAEQCRRAARHNAPCCPVRCGGDAQGEIFGSDPSCCEEGESCLDPASNISVCCPPGERGCGGECCPNGACIGGSCCRQPTGAVCGNQCCGALDRCCGGTTCCTGSCIGAQCCQTPSTVCDNRSCCRPGETCCNGICCSPGQLCDAGTGRCRIADPCPRRCANGECCPEDMICCAGSCQDPPCVR